MYTTTETASCADLLLPAAGWGEKDGTFINSERRIGLIKRVRRAPGQALSDFHIFRLVAEAWGCGELFARWETPEDVFQSLRELSRGRPCDFTGITDYAMLEREGGVQWPLPEGAALESSERRLFGDGRYYHPNGRARFRFEAPRPVPEPPDAAYPLVLITGRGSSAQWHTQTRTAKSAVLRKLYRSELCVEIHPKDAHRFGIEPEEWVRVSSRRGSLEARALVRETVREGEIFLPMHDAATNRLTYPAFDPYSRQPSYKHCAVRVKAAAAR
jgi:assimilatory nitrate reductase catalytic subunit